MSTLAIEGMQWGDEGKGKITDLYAMKADIVVRSQGGNNAGHSIQHNGVRYALRLLPSGILINKGITKYNLVISSRATILLPYHIEIDKAREEALKGNKIGTTKNGIGPCYEDKAARLSIRMGDLLDLESLRNRLEAIVPIKNLQLQAFGGKPVDIDEIFDLLKDVAIKLKDRIIDTTVFLRKAYKENI